MNDNRMKRQIQHSIDTRLSGLQPDPWLAQRLLAGEEKNMDINRSYKVSMIRRAILIVAALLALSAIAFAATKLNLFSIMTRYANSIIPLEGAEELVETGLGSAENEWATVTVEEAAYDGQGAMTLVRITPKEPEKYALFNSLLMDMPEDEYEIETVQDGPRAIDDPYLQLTLSNDEGEHDVEIINEESHKQMFIDGVEVPLPESINEAMEAFIPVYLEGDILYWADSSSHIEVTRKDGKAIMDFGAAMYPSNEDSPANISVDGSDAEVQPDGSVLVWCDGYAEETLPDALDLNLSVALWVGDEKRTLDIPFTLTKSETERVARYMPDDGGTIGDHVRVRDVTVHFTPVRAYLTVDYDYEEQPDEPMGVWLCPYDAEGNVITTDDGSTSESSAGESLGFYRQLDEMQSFDDIPEIIVLEAKVIAGESLGQCVCRITKSE